MKLLGLGLITLLFTSCLTDKVDLTEQKLEGRWVITEAYREGRETRTLTDGFFEFSSMNQFKTNILNDDRSYKYTIAGNRIVVESKPKVNYTVLQMLSDTLIMRTEIQKLDFKFISVKSQHHDHTHE